MALGSNNDLDGVYSETMYIRHVSINTFVNARVARLITPYSAEDRHILFFIYL